MAEFPQRAIEIGDVGDDVVDGVVDAPSAEAATAPLTGVPVAPSITRPEIAVTEETVGPGAVRVAPQAE